MTDYSIRLIRDDDELARVSREQWNGLLDRSIAPQPFLTHAWLTAWWRHLGRGSHLHAITVWLGNQLVCVFPLMITRRGPFSILEFIGTGRSDYLDALIDKDHQAAAEVAFDYLWSTRTEWSVAVLYDVLNSNRAEWWRDRFRQKGAVAQMIVRTAAPYKELPDSWEQYLHAASRNFRRDLKRKEDRLRQEGDLSVVSITQPQDILAVLPELFAVDAESWKAEAGSARFAGEDVRMFFRTALLSMSENGQVEIWLARLDGSAIAFNLTILYGTKIYFYNGTYASSSGRHSPGFVLTGKMFRDACGRGLTEIDFLRGEEVYKQRWTEEKRDCYQIVAGRKTPASLLYRALMIYPRWYLKRFPWALKWKLAVERWRSKLLNRKEPKPMNPAERAEESADGTGVM